MTAGEALKVIRQLAKEVLAGHEGAVVISDHADQQMSDLGVDRSDAMVGLAGARSCKWQPEHETWKVQVRDVADVRFAVAVDIQDSGELLDGLRMRGWQTCRFDAV